MVAIASPHPGVGTPNASGTSPIQGQEKGPSIRDQFLSADKFQRENGKLAALPLWRKFAAENKPESDSQSKSQWSYYLGAETSVGVCLLENGQWKEAASYLTGVLELENELVPDYWCGIHAIIGESYVYGGLLDVAKPHIVKGLKLAEQALLAAQEDEKSGGRGFINRAGYSEAQLSAAKFLNLTDNPGPAGEILKGLLAVRFPGGSGIKPGAKGTALRVLALVSYQEYFEGLIPTDQPVLEAYQAALDMGNRLDPKDRFGCLARVTHLHLEAGRVEQAEETLAFAGAQELVDSLDVFDRAWHASLCNRLERTQTGGSYGPFRPAWVELLEHVRGTAREGGVGVFRVGRTRAIAFEAMMQSFQEGGAEAALGTVFESQTFGFLHGQLQPEGARLEDLRSSLEPDSLCLLFIAGRGSIQGFSVPREGEVRTWAIRNSTDLHNRVITLGAMVFGELPAKGQDSGEEFWSSTSNSLRDFLLPKEQQVDLKRYKRIRIVGRETLYNPPFELFEVGGEPLGLTHAISDWPSAEVGLHLERKRAKATLVDNRPLDWVLLSNPKLSGSAAKLVPTLEPLEMDFPEGDRLQSYAGTAATLSQWVQSESTQVAQILGHGVHTESPEWPAALALAPDHLSPTGLVSGRDLLHQEAFVAPPFVFLSVCRGHSGTLRYGDPSAGRLAGVLLAKGSTAVLTSRGDASIYLEPTKLFSQVVREQLSRGNRLDDAVLTARQFLASHKSLGSPTHWAAWQIIGLGSLQLDLTPALFSGPGTKPFWLGWRFLAVGFALALVVFLLLRRSATSTRLQA